ncbi:MAG: aconitase X swivel domain-containing protein [Actinomycetota bacterium]
MEGRFLVEGPVDGTALVLAEPLSFWGGLDPTTGEVVEANHPQRGHVVTGRILVMPSGRGSSSSATVLAESIRLGTAPAGIVLGEADEIIVIGALVADALYGVTTAVFVASRDGYAAIHEGDHLAFVP